jgi:hypothetical protein
VQRRPAAQLRTEIRGFEDVLRGMHEKGGGHDRQGDTGAT